MESRNNTQSAFANTASNNDMFANSQQPQYNAYDVFPNNGATHNFNEAGWGVNASNFPNQTASRGQNPVPAWQQNSTATHLSAANAGFSDQSSSYGRSVSQNPAQLGHTQYTDVNASQQYLYRQPQFDGSRQVYSSLPNRSFNSPAQQGTVTPQALDRQVQASSCANSPYGSNAFSQSYGSFPGARPRSNPSIARAVDQKALVAAVPKSTKAGMFNVLEFDDLCRATNSERMSNFVNIGKEALEWDSTRSAVPVYIARKSRNELRALAGNNPSVLAKLGKKKARISDALPAAGSASVSSPQIKYEQDSSSTNDSYSDDSDSDSDSDEEEESPLPAKRPDNPKDGVEYDTIKALWRSKRKHLSGESIRKGLTEFWDLVKVIRDRWKADTAAVTDAEEKKRVGELPLLQSRVRDQRDMIEAAFKAALKHGHRGIIEVLSENLALVYLCYQFLLDRFKADDVDGGLARAVLETMSAFTTLDKDKIDKTHLSKVLPKYQKKGNAKVKFWANNIVTNAEKATKELAAKETQKKGEKQVTTPDGAKSAVPANKPRPEAVAGVKRSAIASSSDGSAAKKVAITSSKPNGTTAAAAKVNGVAKKPMSTLDSVKGAATGTAATATKKTVVAKPSGFFSSLQSASKKPGTSIADKAVVTTPKPSISRPSAATAAPKPAFSFAETMANLSRKPKEEKSISETSEKSAPKIQKEIPNETPEERTRRLRKEQRRKLHVSFKPLNELVEIRYFTHDPEEEVDQGSSQKRDFSDVGGEGRMLKQNAHMMDLDDEDDAAEEEENLRDHRPPTRVDFSTVPEEDRKRNYAKYGGEVKPESEECAVRESYESNNLIVFYTDPSDVPPNPREPSDPYNGEQGGAVKHFGPIDEKYAARARAKKARHQSYGQQMQQAQALPPATPDISSILASLAQAAPNPQQFTQAQPAAAAMPAPFMGMQAPPMAQAAPGNIDLAAILASLNPNGSGQQGGFAAAGAAPMGFAPQPAMFSGGNSNKTNNDSDGKKHHPNYKTKVCRFYQQGTCTKGDACTYVHE